ncbi:MAG: hypothetical protein ORN25_06180 [Caulobacteraceae bacterium]|nr:hypothetical protein [Caulobacteraceae bacterium]
MLKTSSDPEFQDWEKKRREGLIKARWQAAGLILVSVVLVLAAPGILSRYTDEAGKMLAWARIATWVSYGAGMALYVVGLYWVWRSLKARF